MTTRQIAEQLAGAGIDSESAREEARLLVMHFCGVSLAHLLTEPERDYDCPALTEAVEKRKNRYPLQYLFGQWEFMGLPFSVDERCLIPRPDTEVIAEEAIRRMPDGGTLLDLCTGSGCIAAAVLYYTKNTAGYAVELYPETAEAARQNLEQLNLAERCRVITGDATTDLFPPQMKFDVITANPPYVTAGEMNTLEPELSFEPRHALTDEGDGLSILHKIVEIYKTHLKPGGVMLLEHGWRQADSVRAIAERCGMSDEPIRDYGGNTRGAKLRMAKGE